MSVESTESMLTVSPSLSDQAYWALRKMITDGRLTRGERITERALGVQLGVSATPIREAFRRLEHERLIERRDGRNATVVDPTNTHLAQLNLIQAALRGVAARMAAHSATEEELVGIQESYELSRTQRSGGPGPSPTQRITVTREFHALIDRAAHSDVLVDMIATSTAFDLNERVQAVETLQERYPADTGLNEHREILAALVTRDGDRAESLMRAHITRTGEVFLALREGDIDHIDGAPARDGGHTKPQRSRPDALRRR